MATIFFDDFNSYDDGDLNGQGSWAADTTIDIQGTTTYEGAKAVYYNNASNNHYLEKAGTSRADGRISFYVRLAQTNKQLVFMLCEGAGDANRKIVMYFHTDGKLYAIINGGATDLELLSSYSANTWYLIEVEWRSSDKKARYRIDEGTWTDWYLGRFDFTTGLSYFRSSSGTNGLYAYLDHIDENPYSPSVATRRRAAFMKFY